jgi:3-oxoacyl-[acyl-carrier-protein] synthase-1
MGFNLGENLRAMEAGETGIRLNTEMHPANNSLPLSMVDTERLESTFQSLELQYRKTAYRGNYTRTEKMVICSIASAMGNSFKTSAMEDTLLVLSTTKGNIHLLEQKNALLFHHKRVYLYEMAKMVREFFGFANLPLVVSNACISGVVALAVAQRYLQRGYYSRIVVSGCDIISEFVVSGFQAFQALSAEPCRPFDSQRNGLTLGEGAGTMILSTNPPDTDQVITLNSVAITQDANHISGPSRTGEELALAILRTLDDSGVDAGSVDYICAHGTGTSFNDEMEAKALYRCGLDETPVNSLKGYLGHTLGAAGIIESAIATECMQRNCLLPSPGYDRSGVSVPINVVREMKPKEIRIALKTASGFGGCNGAALFQKS